MENEALAREMLAVFSNSQPQNVDSEVSDNLFDYLYLIALWEAEVATRKGNG